MSIPYKEIIAEFPQLFDRHSLLKDSGYISHYALFEKLKTQYEQLFAAYQISAAAHRLLQRLEENYNQKSESIYDPAIKNVPFFDFYSRDAHPHNAAMNLLNDFMNYMAEKHELV